MLIQTGGFAISSFRVGVYSVALMLTRKGKVMGHYQTMRDLARLDAGETTAHVLRQGYDVLKREDGKILKPEGWQPPSFERFAK